ncbi:hypothetical protein [Xenorhabdus innexi]|uniref:hypothetical protein n=1 Tax=Xenorhabdus innexi TaxID=290109 RepID=UPI00117C13F7|nr:hypothetical protein [Xenorhabdus innexi]
MTTIISMTTKVIAAAVAAATDLAGKIQTEKGKLTGFSFLWFVLFMVYPIDSLPRPFLAGIYSGQQYWGTPRSRCSLSIFS